MINKIFASDLDGTVLEKTGDLAKNVKNLCRHLRGIGYEIVYATSRPKGSALPLLAEISYPYWLICNDGAITLHIDEFGDSTKCEVNIPHKFSRIAIEKYVSNDVFPVIFSDSTCNFEVLVHNSVPLETFNQIAASDSTRQVRRYASLEEIYGRLSHIRSITIYQSSEKYPDEIAGIAESIAAETLRLYVYKETRFEGGWWIDLTNSSVNKAARCIEISHAIGGTGMIDIALGNGLNDLEMVSVAAWSACPRTAEEIIKRHASYCSPREEGHGFVNDVATTLWGMQWNL